MTDRKNASLEEKSKARRDRYRARAKLGLKPGDGKEADHIKEKGKGKSYNNGKGNLKAVSKTTHMAKSKRTGTGGRPKGSKTGRK